MGIYKYLRQNWNPELYKQRMIEWRKGNSVTRIEHPTRLDRAHALGYKAKQGYVVVRVKLLRGGRQRPRISSGRKSKNTRRKLILGMNYQWVAEQRANKKYPNCEVVNSYFLAKDGKNYFFEVLMIDRELGKKYPEIVGLAEQRGRVYRGLTSAGRRSRGLRGKGKGYEKVRPSLRAYKRRNKKRHLK
ncbi:MAG: 50S ribosomal protein L15e [archaeon GW2011_AR20]|nr:MAG: 50S ribosomal protein L15e [archaeon GW2011_AR20]MBS3161060.1 50S ribosomal protein L15e [Candidatus Woesearchaeota archaeon]